LRSDSGGPAGAGKLEDFDFELPPELIAQAPPPERGGSRLLVLERTTGLRRHLWFQDLPSLLRPGDLLVLNETRVFPARLRARRATGARIEVLLLAPAGEGPEWTALVRPARKLAIGEWTALDPPEASGGAHVVARKREGERTIVELMRQGRPLPPSEVLALCEEVGETPLPPYIQRSAEQRKSPLDRERYQTVYARVPGSAAAPTAGLHFTPEILESAQRIGVDVARVSLHVGLGTFQPLTEQSFESERLHAEEVSVSEDAGRKIARARARGGRVVAVGTTSVRAIESYCRAGTPSYRGWTDLFLRPGSEFLGVDALVTNFHLPRSSLLVLVSAFAGRELVLAAYREAIAQRYRFYSYGDAMLIL